jgi:hypothetical protein
MLDVQRREFIQPARSTRLRGVVRWRSAVTVNPAGSSED